jgi:malate synthase
MGQPEKTASGLDENVAGALCYSLGWVTGLGGLVKPGA